MGKPESTEGEMCPLCHKKTLALMEKETEVPYFGKIFLFSMTCSNCKYHKSDIEAAERKEPCKYTFEISNEEDMKIRLVKSAEATVKIPHITTITPGPASQGFVTNIEGILNRVKYQIETATDIDDFKLKKSKEFGADEVIDAKSNFKYKADKIIVCVGVIPAIKQAFENIDRAGTILLFAIPQEDIKLPNLDIWRNEITITSSYGAAPKDLQESLELIKDKKINVKDLVTHRFGLEDIQKGFQLVANPKESLKVLVEPNN